MTKIYAIEDADGSCVAVGFESARDARSAARETSTAARARSFDSVAELREFFAADDWLDRYSDDELRYSDEELEQRDQEDR